MTNKLYYGDNLEVLRNEIADDEEFLFAGLKPTSCDGMKFDF